MRIYAGLITPHYTHLGDTHTGTALSVLPRKTDDAPRSSASTPLDHFANHVEEVSPSLTRSYSGHYFSRIPLHAETRGTIQPQLNVNTPGDEYEQEADRTAAEVMRMPAPALQRACACGASPGSECKCGAQQVKSDTPGLQRQATPSRAVADAPPLVHEALASSGHPLDAETRAFMEPRFGHDFSRVRLHTGTRAAESARAVGALAYTVGHDVVFGEGQYAPHTSEGKRLLAHELAHTAQQGAAGIIRRQDAGTQPLAPAPAPIVVPPFTSKEIALPCPASVNEIVPEFIREGREDAVAKLKQEGYTSPTQAQIAEHAFKFLGRFRQRFPAETPRTPTDSDLAIASAEHYSYARYCVAAEIYSAAAMRSMIEGYTLLKDQLSHIGAEGILSADGHTPTKPTRCQNDWGHRGVNDGLSDWAADHPQ